MLKIETLNLLGKDNINFIDLLSISIGKAYLYQQRFINFIGKYNSWNVDLTNGSLLLDDKKYNVECIGTTSKSDNYWYSSEVEKVIPDEYVNLMIKIRNKLEEIKVPEILTKPKILLEGDINPFNLSMIYIAFAPINVTYFCGSVETSIYLFVKDLPQEIFSKIKSTEIISLITYLTSTFNINHKLAIKALLLEFDIDFTEEYNSIVANFSEESNMVIEFNGNSLSNIHGKL